MSNNVAFFIEIRESEVRHISYEAATVANRLAKEKGVDAIGIAVGSGFSGSLSAFGDYGIAEIITVDNADLNYYSSEGYSAALAHVVKQIDPSILVIAGSAMGKDLAPRVAVKLDTELISDVTDIKLNGNTLQAIKPVFAGKARITLNSSSDLQFVTLRPKVFTATKSDSAAACNVSASDFDISSVTIRAKVKEVVKSGGGKMDHTEADIIVSGGRGLQDPSNFAIVESLAESIGAVVGASRAAVDAGWRPHRDQIGQTGKTVSPSVYIAVGISGAIQHLAGMSSSKCIIAINKDPDAPIFKIADYGIVGDLFEVVPALTEEFKKVVN